MLRRLFLSVALLSASVFADPLSTTGDGFMYSTSSSGFLYKFSTTNQQRIDVGQITSTSTGRNLSFFDIAFDTSGALFGVTGGGSLYQIDPLNADASFIGNSGRFINGLASSPDGTLYGTGNSSLYSIDTTTGAATREASTGFTSSGDVAFLNEGQAFMSATGYLGDRLVSLDLASGLGGTIGSAVGNIGFNNVYGLDFREGSLWGLTDTGNTTKLLQIDTTTGAGTEVGTFARDSFGASTAPSTDPITGALSFLIPTSGTGTLPLSSDLVSPPSPQLLAATFNSFVEEDAASTLLTFGILGTTPFGTFPNLGFVTTPFATELVNTEFNSEVAKQIQLLGSAFVPGQSGHTYVGEPDTSNPTPVSQPAQFVIDQGFQGILEGPGGAFDNFIQSLLAAGIPVNPIGAVGDPGYVVENMPADQLLNYFLLFVPPGLSPEEQFQIEQEVAGTLFQNPGEAPYTEFSASGDAEEVVFPNPIGSTFSSIIQLTIEGVENGQGGGGISTLGFNSTGIQEQVVPEPGTLALFGSAALGLVILRRRRRRAA